MSAADQVRADAANDSYKNYSHSDVDKLTQVELDGKKYQIIGYAADVGTGFHATAYKSVSEPYNIIIAYRGTDPGLFSGATKADKAAHALTTLQDIAVDATMVRDAVNPQRGAADAFTAEMLAKAAALGIPMDRIFVAGHSLGGTLAEIEAAKFGLAGTTFNAYGAEGLTEGPPAPGCHLTNYVLANDVVSAANRHIGTVVPLASADDLQSLRAGRYLEAPPGSPPPNALLAMRLDDHSGQHFSGVDSVLAPARLAQYARNYAEHKDAIDRYRNDVYHERHELAAALRETQGKGHDQQAHLPPDIQRQVNEYLAVHTDPSIRQSIEQSALLRGVEQGLQHGAIAVQAGGQFVHAVDERVAGLARDAGVVAMPLNPVAPLVGAAVGEAAHLHGRAAEAVGHRVGDGLHTAGETVERSAHGLADAAVAITHDPGVQAGALGTANRVIDTYGNARVADLAIDTLAHPGQWLHHGVPADQAPEHAVAAHGYARNDPRHPENPDHALYNELHRRIPEASENRLLQCTAACHVKGITRENLEWSHLDERNHAVVLGSGGLTPQMATVDVSHASPPPAQSIQRIQDFDAGQALFSQHIQQQLQRIDMQVSPGR